MIHYRFYLAILRLTMPIMQLLRYSVLFPVMLILRHLTRSLENQTGIENGAAARPTAEDEIMSLVEKEEDSGQDAALEDDERRMIKGIFDLDNTPVREIMTPRVDLETLPVTATISEAKRKFISSGHSRIPVYRETIDEITGIIFAKDFLDEARCAAGGGLASFLHKAVFVPESKNVGDLLEELKRTGNHLALVIDEYGGLTGVVTLEDIIEEIVGEIRDEYDTPEDAETTPEVLADGSLNLDARYLISDINENYDLDLSDENADTIGGYVCGELGRIPETGEKLLLDNRIAVKILKADRRKILSLNILLPERKNEQ